MIWLDEGQGQTTAHCRLNADAGVGRRVFKAGEQEAQRPRPSGRYFARFSSPRRSSRCRLRVTKAWIRRERATPGTCIKAVLVERK